MQLSKVCYFGSFTVSIKIFGVKLIFYCQLIVCTLQFALIDRSTKNKYNLIDNMPRRELTQELLESTNGIRTGTWVYDLTETDPKRPDPCPKTGKQKYNSQFQKRGMVHVFPIILLFTSMSYACHFALQITIAL